MARVLIIEDDLSIRVALKRVLTDRGDAVTLASDGTVRPALDAVIGRARDDGSLARWAREEGVSWSAPVAPDVSRGPSLAELTAD